MSSVTILHDLLGKMFFIVRKYIFKKIHATIFFKYLYIDKKSALT